MSTDHAMQGDSLARILDPETDTSGMEGRYLTFASGGQMFGVPIADVVQIVGMQEITPIPAFPDYAKGVINLRGTILPVIDVRMRFGKEAKEYDERTCIMITVIDGSVIGFIVDAVDAVLEIAPELISPAPRVTAGNEENAYLVGIARLEKEIVLLLDTEKILSATAVADIMSETPAEESAGEN